MSRLLYSLGFYRSALSVKGNAVFLAIVISSFGVLLPNTLVAQTATDACGLLPGNKYPVNPNGDCIGHVFNLLSGWTGTAGYPSCAAVNQADGFAWFTASATNTTIEYAPDLTFDFFDAVLQILDGCSASPTQLGCANTGTFWATETITIPTIPGNNYVIRVQRVGSNSGMTGSLCIHSLHPPLPTTGNCTYTLTLRDAIGNGWSNSFFPGQTTSSVEILIGGISYGSYAQTYFSGTPPITFGVNDGQVVQLIYDASGPSQSDNSFKLISCSGDVLYSSPYPPISGSVYSSRQSATVPSDGLSRSSHRLRDQACVEFLRHFWMLG